MDKWKKLYEAIKAKMAKKEALTEDEQKAFPELQKMFETPTDNSQISVDDNAHNAGAFLSEIQKSGRLNENRDGVISAGQKMQDEFLSTRKAIYQDVGNLIGDPKEDYLKAIRTKSNDPKIKELQDCHDALAFVKIFSEVKPELKSQIDRYTKTLFSVGVKAGILSKAMYSSSSGYGLEFVPTEYSARLLERIELERKLPNVFENIPLYQKTTILPVAGSQVMAYKQTEPTGDTPYLQASQVSPVSIGTASVTFTVKGMVLNTFFSYDLFNFSIIPYMDYIRGMIAKAIINAEENAILNGDTTASHMDASGSLNHADPSYGTSVSSDKLWKGIRKLALAGSLTTDLSTLDADTILTHLSVLGKYFQGGGVINITSPALWFKLLGLTDKEGKNVFLTRDVAGDLATIFTGRVPMLYGTPVFMSAYQRNNLDSTGVSSATAENNVKSAMASFATGMFKLGTYMNALIETDKIIASRQYIAAVTAGADFVPVVTPSATEPICCLGINITV